MIKASQPSYSGYKFRSRLEARWAVFFTALGLQWVYEPEGLVRIERAAIKARSALFEHGERPAA